FLDTLVNEYSKFDVRLLSNNKARIKYIKDDKTVEQTIDVGKVQKTPFGNILVRKTTDTGNLKKYGGKSIIVERLPIVAAADKFLANLNIRQLKDVALLGMTMNDSSPLRAEDILVELINVYNEEVVKDKLKVADATADFIKERIRIIEDDLSVVE